MGRVRFFFTQEAKKGLEKIGIDITEEKKELEKEYNEAPCSFPSVRDYQNENG